jgi:hypothetical protein
MTKPVEGPFSELYQLHLDVSRLARELSNRRKNKWYPLKPHIDELFDISMKLKSLNMKLKPKQKMLG